MPGYFPVDHGDLEHPVFGLTRRAYTRWEAYCWLLDHASIAQREATFQGKPVRLDRGQIATSLGDMARAWKWTRPAVQRFIKGLTSANFIAFSPSVVAVSGPDTSADTPTGTQAVSILTICKYYGIGSNKQAPKTPTDTPPDTLHDTHPDTLRETTPYMLSLKKEEDKKRRRERGSHPAGATPSQPDLLGGQIVQLAPPQPDVQAAFEAYQAVARELGLAVPIDLDTKVSDRRGAPTRRMAMRERLTEKLGPESKRQRGLEGWVRALEALRDARWITSGGWAAFCIDDMLNREKLERLVAGRYSGGTRGSGRADAAMREVTDYLRDHHEDSLLHGFDEYGKVKRK